MPSPFPGMDPYLEGYLWPDVHNALSAKIRQLLTPLIRPRYTARLNIYVVEDVSPEGDIGILYPDVEIMRSQQHAREQPPGMLRQETGFGAVTPAALTIPVILPIDIQLTSVEIRDTAQNQLITSIELLSPVNKREPGLQQYRLKRQRLYQAGVHLLELDLLRRGTRPISHPTLPDVPYLITLTRAHTGKTNVWPLHLKDAWPNIPVPLRQPDDDVVLHLGSAFSEIYDEAAYDLSLNYQEPPPAPALSDEDKAWVRALLDRR
ncbi:DUF4058 family protein [Candidatus Chloroploca sp. Khr17]|uniref:DUF4058 family protein n=1 Tax=Candidatus Chloroploca sp. Khr17 TaxID=2496869 RepID=UPI00101DBF0C|nr:DUF4058 family protein [Candidatus Chloroploca sp. Khr17]